MNDKILFWQDFDLTTVGLAKALQEKHECDLYAIIDTTDRTKQFFQQQQFVKYQKTWFYHDHISPKKTINIDYLKSIEQKYKINLWKIVYNDRIFFKYNDFYKFTTDEILSIVEQGCRLFENILDEVKPDFLVISVTNSGRMHIFYEICKARGIKILMLVGSRLGYRSMISGEAEKIDYIETADSSKIQRTFKELQNYLKGHDSFKEAADYSKAFHKSKLQMLKVAIAFFLFYKNTNLKTHYTYYGRTKLRALFNAISAVIKVKYRQSFINKNLVYVIENEPFIFFPLITDPERGLLIAAPFHTNQLELITHAVKSLPVGYKLYVKDHPSMITRDWRPVSFYKQIMSLPNVKLLHPSIPPEEILKKCSLVITIGGTAGLEAAFYGKLTITFVDTLYSRLKSVHILKNIEELPNVINTSLQKKVELDDLNGFINLIDKNSFEFNWNVLLNDLHNTFFYGGFFQDTVIKIPKMKYFLEKYTSIFELLASEYIKKIKQHKEHQT